MRGPHHQHRTPRGRRAAAAPFVAFVVEGTRHLIPRSWLNGFCRAQGGLRAKTHQQAAQHWHEEWKRQQQRGEDRDR